MKIKTISFWCDRCGIDEENTYHEKVAHYPSGVVKWNESRCVLCGDKIIRYITERHLDPYFFRSKKVKMERMKHEKDLIQPSDPRFKKLYPAEYERIEAVKEANEKKKKDEIKQRDDMHKRYGRDPVKRRILSKLYNS